MIRWTRRVTLSDMTPPHYTDPLALSTPSPRRSRTWLLVLAVAIGFAVGGTVAVLIRPASSATMAMAVTRPPAVTTSPAPNPPTAAAPALLPTSFSSAMQLVETLNANGLPCGPPDEVANPSIAETLVDCGPNVVVGVYASHKLAEGAFTVLASTLAGTDVKVHMAIGSNWTVSAGDPNYAQQAAKLFGGTYRST